MTQIHTFNEEENEEFYSAQHFFIYNFWTQATLYLNI